MAAGWIKQLQKEIMSVYYNSTIVYVNQVDLVNEKTFFISWKSRIKIQSKNFV